MSREKQSSYCGIYELLPGQRYGSSSECFKKGFKIGYVKGIERGRLLSGLGNSRKFDESDDPDDLEPPNAPRPRRKQSNRILPTKPKRKLSSKSKTAAKRSSSKRSSKISPKNSPKLLTKPKTKSKIKSKSKTKSSPKSSTCPVTRSATRKSASAKRKSNKKR